jgi:hypothetical protein
MKDLPAALLVVTVLTKAGCMFAASDGSGGGKCLGV